MISCAAFPKSLIDFGRAFPADSFGGTADEGNAGQDGSPPGDTGPGGHRVAGRGLDSRWSRCMDLKGMAEKLGFEEKDFLELVQIFVDATRTDLDLLEQAVAQGDLKRLIECAHSLKGAAGTLGIRSIQDMAKVLVDNARKNILEGSTEAVAAIRKDVERLAATIEKKDKL